MTNYNDEILIKIKDLLRFVTESSLCDFYRNKYKKQSLNKIDCFKDFQKLPFLTKDEFINLPHQKRIYTTPSQKVNFSFSSGTTNSGNITIMQNFSGDIYKESLEPYEYGEQLLKEGLSKKVMLLWPITSSAFSRHISSKKKNAIIIPADVHNLEISAYVAKKVCIDGIISTSTILYFFIESLSNADFDFTKIKWISLGGEFCSRQKLQYFKEKFPNAFFSFRFGSSEIRGRGYRCKHLASKNPNVFHPSPFGLIEIDNPDNDGFGEIIHTTINPRPFPLIRYRTGDIASLEEKACECGNNFLLTLHGRSQLDTLKVSGITLHVQMIENAIDEIRQYIEPQFQVHVYENKFGERFKIQLELHLLPKKDKRNICSDAIFNEIAIEKISNKLKLSSKASLSDLVKKEIFMPLKIIFKESSLQHGKAKYIISHLN